MISRDEPDLARLLGAELLARGAKLALAESCTGGLLAGRITSVPGISAVFERGWIVYANEAKVSELGVDPAVLARHGAVSAETAEALALGAARRSGARLALAVTGVAGPGGARWKSRWGSSGSGSRSTVGRRRRSGASWSVSASWYARSR